MKIACFLFTCLVVTISRGEDIACGDPVGFHANLGRPITRGGGHQVVVYSKVLTNVGQGYSPQTGKFTSPEDGLYSFSWTSLVPPGKNFESRLMVNRKKITGNRADAGNIRQFVSATKNAVVQMKAGDVAYIQSFNGNTLYGDGNQWSSFSGFKISS